MHVHICDRYLALKLENDFIKVGDAHVLTIEAKQVGETVLTCIREGFILI
jgi:hypothetical protein